jgi:hypothetical protein
MMKLNVVQLRELAYTFLNAAHNYFGHPRSENLQQGPFRCDNGLITHTGQFVRTSSLGSIGVVVSCHPIVILWQNGVVNVPILKDVKTLSYDEVTPLIVAAWFDELPQESIQEVLADLSAKNTSKEFCYSPYVQAIKNLREAELARTGVWMSLKDAKDVVDAIKRGDYPKQKTMMVLVSCVEVEE